MSEYDKQKQRERPDYLLCSGTDIGARMEGDSKEMKRVQFIKLVQINNEQIAFKIITINASIFDSCEYHAKNCNGSPSNNIIRGISGTSVHWHLRISGLKGTHLNSDTVEGHDFPFFQFHLISFSTLGLVIV